MIQRLRARWKCHRSIVCCQYVDLAMCNSPKDTHRLGRIMWTYRTGWLHR